MAPQSTGEVVIWLAVDRQLILCRDHALGPPRSLTHTVKMPMTTFSRTIALAALVSIATPTAGSGIPYVGTDARESPRELE